MATPTRRQALQAAGLIHPHPAQVTAALFDGTRPFFLPDDKVQVKYEMLRAHALDGRTASAAAADHGYSRAAFYLIADAFAERGMLGLLDERPGRRGPLKLTGEVATFIASADPALSGAALAELVRARFGVALHRRTVERARQR
jgi:hypothetical protein